MILSFEKEKKQPQPLQHIFLVCFHKIFFICSKQALEDRSAEPGGGLSPTGLEGDGWFSPSAPARHRRVDRYLCTALSASMSVRCDRLTSCPGWSEALYPLLPWKGTPHDWRNSRCMYH